ncbi:hypothetical protein BGZ98_007440 [Dissophora globulifera]|nr:hypothetical protein BGZ98_007440 [Dissophora globulifera]
MKSLQIPSSDLTHRLEQAFQLIFQTSSAEYRRLSTTFQPLGGLPRTWIIKGDSGAGKTYLANALCEKYNVQYVVTIAIGELAVMYPGDLLKGFKACLASIERHKSAVVILDNIELIFPREDGDFSLVHAFQSWLRDLLEHAENTSAVECDATPGAATLSRPRVMILGLTQAERGLDPAIMSLFDDTIELDIPTPEERYVILKTCIFNRHMSLHLGVPARTETTVARSTGSNDDSNQDPLAIVSMKCHGYLAADLDALCVRSATVADRQGRSMDRLHVQDFMEAMTSIRISALRQSASVQKVDPVHWSDIGGLEGVKKTLEESVIWLYKHAEAYARMGISPSKGVLLYGPPGTGKTLLAKAVATESEANFMAVSIPDLIKGEVGESEKAIAKVFKMATRLVYVPPPTFEERVAILEILKHTTRISDNVDLKTVANLTNNFTGADMKALVRKAGLCALKANRKSVESQDFFTAATEVQPSVSPFGLLRYQQFRR